MKDATPGGVRWIYEHVLALLALGSFAYFYWLTTKIDLSIPLEQLQAQLQLPPEIVLAGTLSFIAAIVFWFHMWRDFLRERPARHAPVWGLFLVIGAHLTALVYFVAIWRPRHRAGSPAG